MTTPVTVPAASVSQYRCDRNITFAVRFGDDSAAIDSAMLGKEMLLRDAGGLTQQQTVYSNARMRAEFGLGGNGRAAILRVASPPLVAHCAQH
ncbi:MAG: hypothetical protein ABIU58_06140 [Ramlibacter sp.]